MKIDYLIEKLKEQLQKIHQSDTEVWLRTTYALLLDHFPSYSQRASNFYSLITDFKMKNIYGITSAQTNDLKNKAVEYLNEIIQYLFNLQEAEKQEAILKANVLKLIKESQPKVIHQTTSTVITPEPSMPVIKTQLPFNFNPTLFWTIFTAITTASFFLGLYFGTAKFDREKSDYYEQTKQLKVDTAKQNKLILSKDKIIKQKDESLSNLKDSLSITKKNLENLYLHISNFKK